MYKLLFLLFENQHINISTLKERSFNLRWAEVEKGIIPLTAADLDFPCATPIIESIYWIANEELKELMRIVIINIQISIVSWMSI